MHRMSIIKTFSLLAGLPAIAGYGQNDARPNVLLIMVDDLRPELGCYGEEAIRTPVMDSLANHSLLFRNAYCNAPVSGASRASMLTGLYPKLPERFTHAYTYAEKDAPDAIPLPRWFRDHGYHTLSNGKVFHNVDDHATAWSEQPWRVHREGYESHWAVYNKWELWMSDVSARTIHPKTMRGPFYESAEVSDSAYQDGKVALKTIADLRRMKEQNQPFFLACGFWRPHLPFNAPKKYWDLYNREEIPLADNFYRSEGLPQQVKAPTEINSYGGVGDKSEEDFQRLAKHGYYACVSYVDAQIGLLLNELRELSLEESTIVVILGDHGWQLGEHSFWGKHTLMKRSTQIPLIIYLPGQKGAKSDLMVELVDLYPTLCDLTGIPQPEGQLQGLSFAPSFTDSRFKGKEAVFVQWGNGDNAINRRYSYAKWRDKRNDTEAEMMFDHQRDPEENRNVADERAYRPMKNHLSRLIDHLRSKL